MGQSTIVGRAREIERLSEAIESAAEGRGSVWFLLSLLLGPIATLILVFQSKGTHT